VEQLAHLDAAADEVLARRVDVVDDQLEALSGARLGSREALPECDRAPRLRRCQLDRPDVVA
jgi:hypothetical protein